MVPTSRLAARAALDLLVYSALDWPGKTVRLDPDSGQSYIQRASSPAPSIAELYHANSRLAPSTAQRLLATRTDTAELRRMVIERSASSIPGTAPGDPSPPEDVLRLLRTARDGAGIDLFFALELRLVDAEAVYAFEPIAGRCALVATLAADQAEALEAALHVLGPEPGAPSRRGALLLVIGRFGRNDALYGPRGYRRTLIEAGRLSQELLRRAHESGIDATLITEFADDEVDRAALADGVEDGCLVALELGSGG